MKTSFIKLSMEQCSKKEIDNEEMKKSVVGCLRCLTFLKLLVLAASTWQDVENSYLRLKGTLSYGLIYGV
ncbi:hypothetical protein WN944_015762 [Citrus x changshan-huyou]|uniref:Uncharacterized protein n=1 Tax=Citrus x changshan-huyou TaxID=2935761 RepID=A0AAP0M9L2_9ROSI